MRASLLFSLPLLASCYLSHTVGDDGGARDLGRADTSVPPRDAGTDIGLPDSDLCRPRAANGNAIRTMCEPDRVTCPTGYSCDAHAGAVLQFLCGIECPTGCECPAETTCATFTDKAGTHLYCQPMPILI